MVESAESSTPSLSPRRIAQRSYKSPSSSADITDDEKKHLLFGRKNMRLSEELVPIKQLDIIEQNHHPECSLHNGNNKKQECFQCQGEQEGGNCNEEEKRAQGRIFIYMQILHISDICTAAQEFHAKFYLKATWVQPKLKESKYFSTTPQFVDHEHWPRDVVYKPNISFSNAIDSIQMHDQTIGVSSWRKAKILTNSKISSDYVVMEWKAHGSGNFTHKFELENYPRDTQLLKITMESLDSDIVLHDDSGSKSIIRKNYFVDNGFSFRAYKDLLNEKDFVLKRYSQVLMAAHDKCTLTSKREFTSLSYIVPSERFGKQAVRDIVIPVLLISFSTFTSFVFPPNDIEKRLTVSITIGLVMAAYSYQVSGFLPRMEKSNAFMSYVFQMFVIVFLMVILNSISAFIACNGQCPSEDPPIVFNCTHVIEETEQVTFGAELVDYILYIFFMLYWLVVNICFFYKLFHSFSRKEKKRIEKLLTEASNSCIEVESPFEFIKGESKSLIVGYHFPDTERTIV